MVGIAEALRSLRTDKSYAGLLQYADLCLAMADDAVDRVERNTGIGPGVADARAKLIDNIRSYNVYAVSMGLPVVDVPAQGGLEDAADDALSGQVSEGILHIWDGRRR